MKIAHVLFLGVVVLHAASFETASIKASPPGSTGSDTDGDNGYLRMRNVTLKRCIRIAYGFPEARILDGPKWLDESHFDIVARSNEPVKDIRPLLQPLLAERFHLSLHHETRQVSGFSLTLMKGGIKAKASPPGGRVGHDDGSNGHMNALGFSMDRLASRLMDFVGAPVVNNTELQGIFDFSLNWSPEDIKDPQVDSAAPWLPTALQEQLGLKLEARKVPVDFLVIDHAELPTEN